MAWAKEQMAAYKYPRIVEFRDDLPMTATGKILKRELGCHDLDPARTRPATASGDRQGRPGVARTTRRRHRIDVHESDPGAPHVISTRPPRRR